MRKNFISIHPTIEWGKTLELSKKLEWFNGISMGGYIFYFQSEWDEFFTLAWSTETEISLGLSSTLNNNINRNEKIRFNSIIYL